MIEPVDPDYTQGDGRFCPHSPLHSLHNNSLLSRREEGRKEEGEGRKLRWKKSNCWSKCEVKCSGSAKREGAVSYFERCGFSVGSSSLSFFVNNWRKNLQLDQYYQISFAGALSLALKSIFFPKSCHVWDYACDGLSHHPPLAHTLLPLRLPLRHRGWSKSYQSCLAFFYLFFLFDIVIANTSSFCCSPDPPQHAGLTAWRNGIGCVWRDVPGQHVRPGLLG